MELGTCIFVLLLSSGFVFLYVGVIVGNQPTYLYVSEKGRTIEERNRQETKDKTLKGIQ